jgi:hypothetical protein
VVAVAFGYDVETRVSGGESVTASPVRYTPEMLRCFFLLGVVAFAQDPYKTLPKNYTLELDNAYVRISRVKYSPRDRLPEHAHPSIPTVYIYLTDGGPIHFVHKTPRFALERPPVKAGSVRFNRNAQVETHEVEYRGDAPSEYLRVELKTAPGPPHRDARLRLDADFPWSDPQLRISRVRPLPTLAKPSVLIDIAARSFTWFDSKQGSAAPAVRGEGLTVILELLTEVVER